MAAKEMTHVGKVHNHNYGKPYAREVKLRETANFWIDEGGGKYRKRSGYPAGADAWNQSHLKLDSIMPIIKLASVRILGASSDRRTCRWEVACVCKYKFEPSTTLLRYQMIQCPKCNRSYKADWNLETVVEIEGV